MAHLCIDNVTIVTMNDAAEVIERACLVVQGNSIAFVGRDAPSQRGADPAEQIDGTGKVAVPGLINCHTHAAMTLLRGYADDMALREWLETKIWPLERHMQDDDVYWGTMLGIAEMLRGGVTTFNDMYHHFEAASRAIVDGGIRGCPSGVLLGFLPDADERTNKAIEFCERWNGAGNGRLRAFLGPHALYTCPAPLLHRIRDAVADLGARLHIHLAETDEEVATVQSQFGERPVQAAERLGLLTVPALAAHCVKVTPEEMRLLADRAVGVSHNPGSNLKLASGIAPVPEMRDAGVVVGLGTDGTASNNNLDLLEEARLAALIHKTRLADPTTVSAYEALAMATREGARALGMGDRLGQLREGYLADIVLFDFDRPHLRPCHNVVSQLVYAARAGDVDTVIVDGKVVVRGGRLAELDEMEVVRRAEEVTRDLLEKVSA